MDSNIAVLYCINKFQDVLPMQITHAIEVTIIRLGSCNYKIMA